MMKLPRRSRFEDQYEKLAVWEFFGFATDGFFIEVGANEPKTISQTWMLERFGWRGILVEPLPHNCDLLRQERPSSSIWQTAVSSPDKVGEADFYVCDKLSGLSPNLRRDGVGVEAVIRVPVTTLDCILEKEKPEKIDFISIDTEGTELDVLKGFDIRRHNPALVLVEDPVYTVDVHRQFVSSGYRLIRRTGINNWYIPAKRKYSTPFPERARLFRKMFLGTPLRAFKNRMRNKKGTDDPS